VQQLGTAVLLLALLPSLAFLIGVGSGIRRAVSTSGAPDLPLLLLAGFTLAGYVLFTWRNPWFSTVKGTYLLARCSPSRSTRAKHSRVGRPVVVCARGDLDGVGRARQLGDARLHLPVDLGGRRDLSG